MSMIRVYGFNSPVEIGIHENVDLLYFQDCGPKTTLVLHLGESAVLREAYCPPRLKIITRGEKCEPPLWTSAMLIKADPPVPE
jgi:hypothetical protein